MKRRAGIYARISKDRKGDMLGVGRQEDACRKLAAEAGWEVVDLYVDDDLSAYKGKRRPGWERLLTDMRGRSIDAVLALHPDRFNRDARDLEDLIDAVESSGCLIKTVHFDHYDLSRRSGRTSARLISAVARDESEAKAERYADKHAELARRGRWKGGPRPYGYDVARDLMGKPVGDGRLVVVPEEAAVIQDAVERALAGETLYSICSDLNERLVPTAQGAKWRTQTMRRILTDWTHVGIREHHGDPMGEATWPPIIGEADHRRLRLLLLDPSRSVARRARVFLLSGGYAHCGLCGQKLVGMRREKGVRTYACQKATDKNGCGGIYCGAEALEALVVEAVMLRLDTPQLAQALQSGAGQRSASDPAAELVEAKAKLDELADMWSSGEITRPEWLRARRPVEDRRERAERRLNASTRANAAATWASKAGALRAAWPAMSLDQRRAVLGAVIERVIVNPTKVRGRFDPERVDVEWRA
jgi:site-specific DNA recombinase